MEGFRDKRIIAELKKEIEAELGHRRLRIMHVCGSHEHTITYWALRGILPEELELIAGPGCPVCVSASHEVGEAIELAREGLTILTFGDMMMNRTRFGSLMDAKSDGADVRIIYSPRDAIKIAKEEKKREFVFFSIGFETTTAPIASMILEEPPANFSILTSNKRTSPAVDHLLQDEDFDLDGIIAPGHVSTIVGAKDWERFPKKYGITTVVAGFEPVDVLLAILIITKAKKPCLYNEYRRLVKYEGNTRALALMDEVFEVDTAWWRGMGWVPESGYYLKEKFKKYNAREKYGVSMKPDPEEDIPKGCSCHLIVTGRAYPTDCPLFGNRCTPENPYGPCMVSVEGTCQIWYRFGNIKKLRR